MIELIKYILLGITQGFTEPLPISSSGHIMVLNNLLNTNIDIGLLAIMTNFGSLLAIIYLYRKKIYDLIKDFFGYIKTKNEDKKDGFKYCLLIVVATIPAGIMGIIVTKLELFNLLEKNIKFVGITLLITAGLLFLIRNIKGKKTNGKISYKDAIIIGLFQVVALIPGISRSGATIVGGMSRNLTRETAFDFSFMLYIPISIATALLGIKDLVNLDLPSITIIYYLLATLISGIITYFATKWFKNIVKEGKLIYFVIYCLVIGLTIILFL